MPTPHDTAAAEARLLAFLAMPSVGTDPAYDAHTVRCAEWVADQLRAAGLAPRLESRAGGHPCVIASTTDADVANPGAPRVLFYGHYDVQPADPLELWTTPPFTPAVRDGKVYARGASDDKGQVLCFLEALRALRAGGAKLPGPVTVCIEGEEESKARTLPVLVEEKTLLPGAVVLVSDTALWMAKSGPMPSMTTALRGITYMEVRLHALARDLHSGVYGGGVVNPATHLCRILGQLHDAAGRVQIPGFYDGIAEPTAAEKAALQALDFDEAGFLASIGATAWGEQGYSTLERVWFRPTCEICGIFGGYAGEGAKTVIPAWAGAKVSFRTVAPQDGVKLEKALHAFLEARTPPGCRWEFINHGHSPAVQVASDSPFVHAAKAAIARVSGRAPAVIRDGASIPVASDFKRDLGLDTLFVGFGLHTDNIHSPDEHFGLDRFHQGIRTHVAILEEFAKLKA